MNLQTITTVSKELGVSDTRIRKAVKEKRLRMMRLGTRMLVDMDEAREVLEAELNGATIKDVMAATGLRESAIRRGVREGWLHCQRTNKHLIFDLDEVLKAIEQRMD